MTPGAPAPWRDVLPEFGLVGVGQALSVLLIGAGPVIAVLLASEDDQLQADVLVGVLLLARAPLLAFYAVQATLLPRLSLLVASSQVGTAQRRVVQTASAAAATGLVGTAIAWAAGPAVVRWILGREFDLSRGPVAAVVAATALYVVAAVGSQAGLAFGGHRWLAATWSAGAAGYAALLMLPLPLVPRICTAFVGGTAIAAAVATTGLSRHLRPTALRPEAWATQGGHQGEHRPALNRHRTTRTVRSGPRAPPTVTRAGHGSSNGHVIRQVPRNCRLAMAGGLRGVDYL